MAQKNEIYKCGICGNIVEILHAGGGGLVCCGQPMNLMRENTVDASQEKHVPVITKIDGGYKVTVGSVAHPMEEKHFIEWIALKTKQDNQRKALNPGEAPAACFKICDGDEVEAVYAYCNLHSLWKA